MIIINVMSDYTSSVYCNPPSSRSKASRSSELQSLACPGGLAEEFDVKLRSSSGMVWGFRVVFVGFRVFFREW